MNAKSSVGIERLANRRSDQNSRQIAPRTERGTDQPSIGWVYNLSWQILATHNAMEEIRGICADALEISRPQLIILTCVHHIGKGSGTPVKSVASVLHIDPSFVTTQSKLLETKGLLKRTQSAKDARIVLLALTSKALKQIANIKSVQDVAFNRAFSDFSDRSFSDLNKQLSVVTERLEKAKRLIVAES